MKYSAFEQQAFYILHSTFYILLASSILLFSWGCAGSKSAGEKKEKEPFIIEAEPEKPRGMQLAEEQEDVRSIQLYRLVGQSDNTFEAGVGSETQFPTLVLGSAEALRLEFDLMEPSGRPLTVYFYHADVDWQRDLHPAEYLGTFQRDDLIDYTPSRATDIPYTHYSYQFPNASISFLLSGNYILRVAEQGNEDDALFERPFFISEQATNLQMGIESMQLGRGGFSSIQPAALFIPPAGIDGNVFDYTVCFVRNGRFEAPRCAEQPSLIQQPALRFYLEPSQAFEPVVADYFLDLSAIQGGTDIERIDFNAVPYRVTLEPDLARFPGDPLDPILNGQTVVSGVVKDVADPDISAQYVNVQFSYVPDTGRPLGRDVILTGSFNGWQVDPANKMSWNGETESYVGEMLLKQGFYDYRYVISGDRLPRGTVPRPENLYLAMVYFSDLRVNTDRLLAMGSFLGR